MHLTDDLDIFYCRIVLKKKVWKKVLLFLCRIIYTGPAQAEQQLRPERLRGRGEEDKELEEIRTCQEAAGHSGQERHHDDAEDEYDAALNAGCDHDGRRERRQPAIPGQHAEGHVVPARFGKIFSWH